MLETLLLKMIAPLAQAAPTESSKPLVTVDAFKNNWSSDGLISTHWLLIAAGGVLLLLSGLSIANWWKHRGDHAHPLLVFSNTAQAIGLSYRQQWTLFWLARHQSLASPLTLMLSPGTFDHHAKNYLESRLNWRREPVRSQLQDIRHTLFADLPQPTATA